VNDIRWVNPHQPQTLFMGVVLCYFDAVLGLLSIFVFFPIMLLIAVGLGAGGFGIANEKKWGYTIAVAAAVAQVLITLVGAGLSGLTSFGVILPFLFDVALVALLLHPMSRDYQRIWFR